MITPPKFVGLGNYITMFSTDALFRQSIVVTSKYVLISVPLSLALALFLAVLLNQKIRFSGFWRTGFYLPAVISGVAGAVIWRWMYHNDLGIINAITQFD